MDQSNRELGGRLRRISRAMEQVCGHLIAELELTPVQGYILGYLSHHPEQKLTSGELGRHFELSPPTVSGILQRLEAKGFVRIEADGEDRRRKWITATDKSMQCDAEIRRKMRESEQKLSAGLSEEELCQLTCLLDKLLANLSATEIREVPHA